jgi:alkylation response protein AidB-like acyl-CoA dehydrogenase
LERYSEYATRRPSVPIDEVGWIQRAQEVADVFAVDAAVRERENKSPRAEVTLLKYAGLLKVVGPQKYGGGGQSSSVAYKTIRKVAEADG